MFHIEDVLQLKDREDVKFILRRHLITLVPSLFLALILIVVPFFMMFPMFGWGVLGVLLFVSSVIIGVVIAIRSVLLWDADLLILTNMRLVDVDQQGIFTRMVTEAALPAVVDVSWSRKGVFETLFRMGSVNVQTSSAASRIEAVRIPRPERAAEYINDLRRDAQPPRVDAIVAPTVATAAPVGGDREQSLKRINAILEKYPPEELARIENVLQARERSSVADEFFASDKAQSE